MMKKVLTISLLAVFVLLLSSQVWGQCSQCRLIVENQEVDMEDIGNGLNTGILYLMAIPYLLLFIFFRKKIFKFFREIAGSKK